MGLGFPAFAGIDPLPQRLLGSHWGFPRVRGDRPDNERAITEYGLVPPAFAGIDPPICGRRAD